MFAWLKPFLLKNNYMHIGFLHTEPERARFTMEIWVKFDPTAALLVAGGGSGGGGTQAAAGVAASASTAAGAKAQAAAVVAAAEAAAVSATALGGHMLLQVDKFCVIGCG